MSRSSQSTPNYLFRNDLYVCHPSTALNAFYISDSVTSKFKNLKQPFPGLNKHNLIHDV